jgi:hypothetical protein
MKLNTNKNLTKDPRVKKINKKIRTELTKTIYDKL